MSLKQALANEPVTLGGVVLGVLLFLLVRYGHMDANSAQQAIAGALPFLGALATRQLVTPVRKLAAANPVATNEATTILRGILDALTINEPAVKVLPPTTDVPLPDGMAVPSVTTSAIPAAPEPWTPPSLDIPPILGAMTATPAAAIPPEAPPA